MKVNLILGQEAKYPVKQINFSANLQNIPVLSAKEEGDNIVKTPTMKFVKGSQNEVAYKNLSAYFPQMPNEFLDTAFKSCLDANGMVNDNALDILLKYGEKPVVTEEGFSSKFISKIKSVFVHKSPKSNQYLPRNTFLKDLVTPLIEVSKDAAGNHNKGNIAFLEKILEYETWRQRNEAKKYKPLSVEHYSNVIQEAKDSEGVITKNVGNAYSVLFKNSLGTPAMKNLTEKYDGAQIKKYLNSIPFEMEPKHITRCLELSEAKKLPSLELLKQLADYPEIAFCSFENALNMFDKQNKFQPLYYEFVNEFSEVCGYSHHEIASYLDMMPLIAEEERPNFAQNIKKFIKEWDNIVISQLLEKNNSGFDGSCIKRNIDSGRTIEKILQENGFHSKALHSRIRTFLRASIDPQNKKPCWELLPDISRAYRPFTEVGGIERLVDVVRKSDLIVDSEALKALDFLQSAAATVIPKPVNTRYDDVPISKFFAYRYFEMPKVLEVSKTVDNRVDMKNVLDLDEIFRPIKRDVRVGMLDTMINLQEKEHNILRYDNGTFNKKKLRAFFDYMSSQSNKVLTNNELEPLIRIIKKCI